VSTIHDPFGVTVLRIATVLAFAVGCLSAQTRIAGVDIGRAFSAYHETEAAMQEIALERVKINEDPRIEQLRELATEAKEAAAAVAKLAGGNKRDLLDAQRFAELKREELQASARAIQEARETAGRELDRKFVEASRTLLEDVRQAAEEIGSSRGFDLVIDSSGNTNTGLPLILYARKLPDLTEAVIARLNADALPQGLESGKEAGAEPDGAKDDNPVARDSEDGDGS